MFNFINIEPENRVLKGGYLMIAPEYQRTRLGTEGVFLLFKHLFDDTAT